MEIAALCLSIKFKQDLHSPLQFFLFAVRESIQVLSLFMPCYEKQCKIISKIQLIGNKKVSLFVKLNR